MIDQEHRQTLCGVFLRAQRKLKYKLAEDAVPAEKCKLFFSTELCQRVIRVLFFSLLV